jgi:HSP20 family protein
MKIEKYGTAGDVQELLDIRDGLDVLLDSHAKRAPLTPKADLLDLGHSYQLHLEVPGVQLADLEIAAHDDELQIAGLREPALEASSVVFTERPVGPFQRTIPLPQPVEAKSATAHLASGVLVVTLPKRN